MHSSDHDLQIPTPDYEQLQQHYQYRQNDYRRNNSIASRTNVNANNIMVRDSHIYNNHSSMNQNIRQRNSKIASLLTMLITLSQKIQLLKEKLCGHSCEEFSPQQYFQALDINAKGYLSAEDIIAFLNNQRIGQKQVGLLFSRVNAQIGTDMPAGKNCHRLTYLGYLNLLRPHFDRQLARDLLYRDSAIAQNDFSGQKRLQANQQNILLLMAELLLLSTICITEHEQIKQALMDQYMLNLAEYRLLIGITDNGLRSGFKATNCNRNTVSPLQAVFEFIANNSEYQLAAEQTKYLLPTLGKDTIGANAFSESNLRILFMPAKIHNKDIEGQNNVEHSLKSVKNCLHRTNSSKAENFSNYNRVFLGRQDLVCSHNNKMNFLNYVHPATQSNSRGNQKGSHNNKADVIGVQRQSIQANKEHNNNSRSNIVSDSGIHIKNINSNSARMKQSAVRQYIQQNKYLMTPSQYVPVSIPRQNSVGHNVSRANGAQIMHTPVLEQFMRDSNIHRNMASVNQIDPHQPYNNSVINQSLNQSSAFLRVDYSKKAQNAISGSNINNLGDHSNVGNIDKHGKPAKRQLHSNNNKYNQNSILNKYMHQAVLWEADRDINQSGYIPNNSEYVSSEKNNPYNKYRDNNGVSDGVHQGVLDQFIRR